MNGEELNPNPLPNPGSVRTPAAAAVAEEEERESNPLMETKTLLIEGLDHEIRYNEQLIQERREEIDAINRASNLISELFQNIGLIVGEQQELIDNIEVSLEMTAEETKTAQIYIERRERQEEKRSSRLCCFLIFSTIITVFTCTLIISLL